METTSLSNHLVTGIFDDRADAEKAFESLLNRGYDRKEIHLIMSDATRNRHFVRAVETDGNKALEGTGTGAVIGGALGAIAAALVAVGSNLIIPGLGLVVAGPIAAALAGAGAGGVTGGVIGALVGAGVPEERAIVYDRDIKNGGIVLGVHADNEIEVTEIADELRLHNAHDIHR